MLTALLLLSGVPVCVFPHSPLAVFETQPYIHTHKHTHACLRMLEFCNLCIYIAICFGKMCIMVFCPLQKIMIFRYSFELGVLFFSSSVMLVCIICVSADIGWWACRFRKRLSVAEPARVRVDQSAGLSLADGHEYGAVHSRVQSKGRGRSAALASGQRQVKGELLGDLVFWVHLEIPPKPLSRFPSGPRRFEPERPFNHQEEAEGPAEGSREAGETEREKREGGSTQWQTTAQHRLSLLRDPHEFMQ